MLVFNVFHHVLNIGIPIRFGIAPDDPKGKFVVAQPMASVPIKVMVVALSRIAPCIPLCFAVYVDIFHG
jgi:hypothetical protein